MPSSNDSIDENKLSSITAEKNIKIRERAVKSSLRKVKKWKEKKRKQWLTIMQQNDDSWTLQSSVGGRRRVAGSGPEAPRPSSGWLDW